MDKVQGSNSKYEVEFAKMCMTASKKSVDMAIGCCLALVTFGKSSASQVRYSACWQTQKSRQTALAASPHPLTISQASHDVSGISSSPTNMKCIK